MRHKRVFMRWLVQGKGMLHGVDTTRSFLGRLCLRTPGVNGVSCGSTRLQVGAWLWELYFHRA